MELIQLLQQDFTVCKNYLRKVGLTIMDEGISKFRIFAAVTETIDLDIGVPIIRHEELGTHYTFNASHLEDFVNKQIVEEQKTKVFIEKINLKKIFLKSIAVFFCQTLLIRVLSLCLMMLKLVWNLKIEKSLINLVGQGALI